MLFIHNYFSLPSTSLPPSRSKGFLFSRYMILVKIRIFNTDTGKTVLSNAQFIFRFLLLSQ